MLKRVFIFIVIILLLALLAYYYPQIENSLSGKVSQNTDSSSQKEPAFVKKAVDGDTIDAIINGKEETIRLLGINTPEKNKPYYTEAKNFLKQLENKTIELLRDGDDTDRYDRKLRYVYYNNQLINAKILERGYATTFMLDELNPEIKTNLINAEISAKNQGLGLWKKSTDKCAVCIKLQELNPEDEFFIIINNCTFNCNLSAWLVKDDANHFFELNDLNSMQEQKYVSKLEVWNNLHDRFFLRDDNGDLVVYYEY